jgi:hypothetical protein
VNPGARSLIVSGTPHQTSATYAAKARATYIQGRWNLAKNTKARPIPTDAHDTEILELQSMHVVQLTHPIVSFLHGLMVALPHTGQTSIRIRQFSLRIDTGATRIRT